MVRPRPTKNCHQCAELGGSLADIALIGCHDRFAFPRLRGAGRREFSASEKDRQMAVTVESEAKANGVEKGIRGAMS